jgi:hypothetical protein
VVDLDEPPFERGQAAERCGDLLVDVVRLGRGTDHRTAAPPDVVVGLIASAERDLPVVTDAVDSKTAVGAAARACKCGSAAFRLANRATTSGRLSWSGMSRRSMVTQQDVGIVRGVTVGHRIVRGEDGARRVGSDDHPAAQSDAGAEDGERPMAPSRARGSGFPPACIVRCSSTTRTPFTADSRTDSSEARLTFGDDCFFDAMLRIHR